MKRFMRGSRCRGLSVVELTLVMFFAVLLLSGALGLGRIALNQQKQGAMIERLKLVIESAHNVVITKGGTTTNAENMVPALEAVGGFPSRFISGSPSSIKTPYGGTISVTGKTGDQFLITISSLPGNSCFGVGQYVLDNRDALVSLKIGTTLFDSSSTTTLKNMDGADLITPCDATSAPSMELTY